MPDRIKRLIHEANRAKTLADEAAAHSIAWHEEAQTHREVSELFLKEALELGAILYNKERPQ